MDTVVAPSSFLFSVTDVAFFQVFTNVNAWKTCLNPLRKCRQIRLFIQQKQYFFVCVFTPTAGSYWMVTLVQSLTEICGEAQDWTFNHWFAGQAAYTTMLLTNTAGIRFFFYVYWIKGNHTQIISCLQKNKLFFWILYSFHLSSDHFSIMKLQILEFWLEIIVILLTGAFFFFLTFSIYPRFLKVFLIHFNRKNKTK